MYAFTTALKHMFFKRLDDIIVINALSTLTGVE